MPLMLLYAFIADSGLTVPCVHFWPLSACRRTIDEKCPFCFNHLLFYRHKQIFTIGKVVCFLFATLFSVIYSSILSRSLTTFSFCFLHFQRFRKKLDRGKWMKNRLDFMKSKKKKRENLSLVHFCVV